VSQAGWKTSEEVAMAVCEVCGNDYYLSFEVHTAGGNVHTFDSFECAAHHLAPVCEHCQCRILGHGVEIDGRMYCCAHCARSADAEQGSKIRDAVGSQQT
jgi:phage terminase large subunit GpA-like protein